MRTGVRPLIVLFGLGLLVPLTIEAQETDNTFHLYSTLDTGLQLDPNGFLRNPRWANTRNFPPDMDLECGFRVVTGALDARQLVTTRPNCLSPHERSIVHLNEANTGAGLGFECASNSLIGDVRGHVNWFPVTVTGQLRWESFSGGVGEDRDLTFNFFPSDSGAVTSGSPRRGHDVGYHIEFYYRETLARLLAQSLNKSGLRHAGETWWEKVRRSLSNKSDMSALVDNHLAIVTGLYGLDGVHDFQAELHPVYSMAVLVDTSSVSGELREQWAVMVRFRGTEGDCANGIIRMYADTVHPADFVVDLGSWPGAGPPRVTLGPGWSSGAEALPSFRVDSSHTYLDFVDPRQSADSSDFLFLGTVFLEWPQDGLKYGPDRFPHWLPKDAGLLTTGIPAINPGNSAPSALKLNPSVAGAKLLMDFVKSDSLQLLTETGYDVLGGNSPAPMDSGWQPVTKPRTGRSLEEPQSTSVHKVCPSLDPVCRSPLTVFVAMGGTATSQSYTLGYDILAHGFPQLRDAGIFAGLGYRVEMRYEKGTKTCVALCTPRHLDDYAMLVSGVIAPNTLNLWPLGNVVTYFISGIGMATESTEPIHFAWDAGFGLRWSPGSYWGHGGFFAQVADHEHTGGFLGHWDLSLGIML